MRSPFLLVFLLCCSFATFAQETFTAGYRTDSITIDGKADEWSIPFRFSDYKSKIVYNIKNDEQNLYFCFKTDYQNTVSKMLRFGFDIYIDTSGKKKKDWHIQFPVKTSRSKNKDDMHHEIRLVDMRQLQLRMKSEVNTIFVEGLNGVPNGILPIANTNDIRAAVDFDNENSFICELSIPLKYIQYNFASNKKPWGITLKMNAPEAPMSTPGGNGGMGGADRRGGMSRDGMSGMGGGMNQGGMGTNGMGTNGINPNGMNNTGLNSGGMGGQGTMSQDMMDDTPGQAPLTMADRQQMYEPSEWKFKLLLGTK